MSFQNRPIYRKHGFTLALLAVLVLAVYYPALGAEGGALRPEWSTKLGVWLIFLMQGLSIPGQELRDGYRPIRLQIFVLAWNYLLFPLVTIACLSVTWKWLPNDILLGFGLLSILPTTIASAITFTSLSGGRTSSAICAAVLSNLLAVLVVPFWFSVYLKADSDIVLPLLPILGKLVLLIVFPLLLGQALRIAAPRIAETASKWTKAISSVIILFIVYVAFANSVLQGQFEAFTFPTILGLLIGALALLLLISALIWWSSMLLNLRREERLAAFYCASQKSLATGVPLLTILFTAMSHAVSINYGALFLPLIVFHPFQLILAAIWSERS